MAITMESIIDEQYLYKSTKSTEITTRSRQDVDGKDGDGGDAAMDDEDRCLSLPDLRREKMDPKGKFPLQIPSGGKVFGDFWVFCMLSP